MSEQHLVELKGVVASTRALLSHMSSILKEPPSSPPSFGDKPVPNALALASTAAALIKAQTTKLSLLVINKPFTPSAISTILKTIGGECIPALATAAQLVGSSPRYPRVVSGAMSQQIGTLLLEFENLLQEIPTDERGISTAQSRGRDALASTGIVWAACDALVSLGEKGAAEVAAAKAEQTHGIVKDAISELKEWLEEDEEDKYEGDDTDGSSSNNGLTIGGCPPHLRTLATRAQELAEHIKLLYPPIAKRRIKKFSPPLTAKTKVDALPSVDTVKRLDGVLDQFRTLSAEIDEMAGLLYEGEEEDAEELVAKLNGLAEKCASSMEKTWDGGEDELTTWLTTKWKPSLEKMLARK